MFVPFLRPLLGVPMTLILVRHGESVRNEILKGRIHLETMQELAELESRNGGADHKTPITPLGHEQAMRAGQYLRFTLNIRPDIIIDSGYTRTFMTSQCINEAFDWSTPGRSNLLWRERETGYSHAMIEAEVQEHLPYLQKYWKQIGGLFARAAGGESLLDVIERRIIPAMQELNRDYAGKIVVVVTHGNTIQCCRVHLDDLSLADAENFLNNKNTVSDNCGITIYRYNPHCGKLSFDSYHSQELLEAQPGSW